jgi:short-subunit dehydrogenase
MAAFSPIAFKTVYPASKAFVHSFTRGMYQEYKKTNVFFSVVYPGPMKTNADVTARINSQGFLGRLGLLSPQKVARLSVNQLFRRDPYIIFSTLNWLFMTITPVWFRLPILSSAMKRELKRS